MLFLEENKAQGNRQKSQKKLLQLFSKSSIVFLGEYVC